MVKLFHGNYSSGEKYFDDSKHLQKRLEDNLSRDERFRIEQKLDFCQRFANGKEHYRICAQRIEIYSFKSFNWQEAHKSLLVPCGVKEKQNYVDFGDIIKSNFGLNLETILEKNVVRKLKNGLFIRGDVFRKIRLKYDPEFPNEYFNMEVKNLNDTSFYYNFSLKPVTAKKPLVFKICSYVQISGENISEKYIVARPYFDQNLNFEKWAYPKK